MWVGVTEVGERRVLAVGGLERHDRQGRAVRDVDRGPRVVRPGDVLLFELEIQIFFFFFVFSLSRSGVCALEVAPPPSLLLTIQKGSECGPAGGGMADIRRRMTLCASDKLVK